MTGTITMDAESLEKLTRLRQKYYKRAIDKYNTRLKSGKFKLYEEALSTEGNPYVLDEVVIPETYVPPEFTRDASIFNISATGPNGEQLFADSQNNLVYSDGRPYP